MYKDSLKESRGSTNLATVLFWVKVMRYLFDNWDNLKEKLKDKSILLYLDYDGTLTPIVETPDKAIIPRETKRLLEVLTKKPKCKLAIISGRSLKDLKKMVGIEGIIYVGNHGLEIEGPKMRFKSPTISRSKGIIKQIKQDLSKEVSEIKGAFVEDKGLTLSLHYRLVDKNEQPRVKNIFDSTLKPYLIRKKVRVTSGKKVFEVRPPVKWDKGKVVLWLLARHHFILGPANLFVFYIGDDTTDEDAFKALKNKGLSILVGEPKPSYAQYYLRTTKEVAKFLERILKLQA